MLVINLMVYKNRVDLGCGSIWYGLLPVLDIFCTIWGDWNLGRATVNTICSQDHFLCEKPFVTAQKMYCHIQGDVVKWGGGWIYRRWGEDEACPSSCATRLLFWRHKDEVVKWEANIYTIVQMDVN